MVPRLPAGSGRQPGVLVRPSPPTTSSRVTLTTSLPPIHAPRPIWTRSRCSRPVAALCEGFSRLRQSARSLDAPRLQVPRAGNRIGRRRRGPHQPTDHRPGDAVRGLDPQPNPKERPPGYEDLVRLAARFCERDEKLMPTTGTRRAGPRTARTGSRSRDSRSPSRRSTNRVTTARPRSPTLSSSPQRSELRQRLCSTLPVVGWRLPTLDSIQTRKPSPGHGHTARGNACNRIRVWRAFPPRSSTGCSPTSRRTGPARPWPAMRSWST